MVTDSKISEYIDAASTSSARSRWVFLIMIVFSVAVFTAFLNSRKGNWISSRLSVAQYAANNFKEVRDLSESTEFEQIHGHALDSLSERAAKFVELYNIQTSHEAEWWLIGYIQSRQNFIQIIHVPILGFSFDVNDLGFLSGLTFTILLLMLRYWLRREHTNVALVFEKAREAGCLERCYQLMSMTQIFTIPPNEEGTHERFWRGPIKALFCLPLALQSIVAFNDFQTTGIGFAFSPTNMVLLVIAHLIALLALAVLTIASLALLGEIDRLWRSCNIEIANSRDTENGTL